MLVVRSTRKSFNPRTRTGCDGRSAPARGESPCFNPRTRTGCDGSYKPRIQCLIVSIHAPARGATFPSRSLLSIPTRFQSTHPHGVRRKREYKAYTSFVSIHAPARGATVYSKHFEYHGTKIQILRNRANAIFIKYICTTYFH